MSPIPHPELHILLEELQNVYDALLNFKPLAPSPPILDSSVEADPQDDGQWLRQENIPGMKKLRESIKFDIDILQKFLSNPASEHEQPITTHAPYLLAVYNEIVCAPPPIVSVFKFLTLSPNERDDRREKKGRRTPSTKVDIVAENGRRWIRINTIKNAGILAELREIDSYLTDSESDSDDPDRRPSLAQTEFDNSILQMGRALLEAAKANPVETVEGSQIPHVTMRLTRLDISPLRPNGEPSDSRIAHTVQLLRDMGMTVELGERSPSEIPPPSLRPPSPAGPIPVVPTRQINLDLSVLVALVSDLTHSPLPASVEEATNRFLPPQRYRDWKPERTDEPEPGHAGEPSPDIIKHSRALTTHVLQEMSKGLLQEIRERLPSGEVEFWTSDEARERCLRIVTRIGGEREIRRAEAMFPPMPLSTAEAEEQFWCDSRYPRNFIPLFPIRMYPAPPQLPIEGAPKPHPPFFRSLTKVCRDLLAASGKTHVNGAGAAAGDTDAHTESAPGPAAVKVNPRLSPHAVKSMLRGAELGWTTLTTTKSSVKALLREVKAARLGGRLAEFEEEVQEPAVHSQTDADRNKNTATTAAALWIVDPRNLQCFV